MFDFPASPAIGDVSNGYVWNGTGWSGGPVVGTPTDQFFNLAGLTQLDITVPTWARGAIIDGSVFVSVAAAYAALQVSIDGSTFYAGTSYYLMGGITHNVSGGYATQAAGNSPQLYIDYPRNNLLIPHIFQAQLSLESNTTSQLITCRMEAQAYDNTSLQGNLIWGSYLNVNLTPPARVQKLRVFCSGGTFTNGYVKISWLGGNVPQSNAITEAPADNAEYVRVNGIWRKKSETFTWTASRSVAIFVCPPGATRLRAVAFVSNPAVQTQGSLGFQGSQDGGATWNTASGAYYFSGLLCDSLTTTTSSIGAQAATWGYLGWQTNNTSVPNHATVDIQLVRPAGGATQAWHSVGGGYHDSAGVGQRTWVINGYLSTGWNTALPINAIQFFNANSTMLAGSIECTWGYG